MEKVLCALVECGFLEFQGAGISFYRRVVSANPEALKWPTGLLDPLIEATAPGFDPKEHQFLARWIAWHSKDNAKMQKFLSGSHWVLALWSQPIDSKRPLSHFRSRLSEIPNGTLSGQAILEESSLFLHKLYETHSIANKDLEDYLVTLFLKLNNDGTPGYLLNVTYMAKLCVNREIYQENLLQGIFLTLNAQKAPTVQKDVATWLMELLNPPLTKTKVSIILKLCRLLDLETRAGLNFAHKFVELGSKTGPDLAFEISEIYKVLKII